LAKGQGGIQTGQGHGMAPLGGFQASHAVQGTSQKRSKTLGRVSVQPEAPSRAAQKSFLLQTLNLIAALAELSSQRGGGHSWIGKNGQERFGILYISQKPGQAQSGRGPIWQAFQINSGRGQHGPIRP